MSQTLSKLDASIEAQQKKLAQFRARKQRIGLTRPNDRALFGLRCAGE